MTTSNQTNAQRRALIVDDSVVLRQMIKDILAPDGWQIVGEAANGHDAIELYKQLKPDAVTLDIVMPDMDGMDALKTIIALDPAAKIVIVSELNQTRVISEAIRSGAQDYIAKPFSPEHLLQSLHACLHS
jgi:two-component system, chemotaxis family, chemotaxis protein CheY